MAAEKIQKSIYITDEIDKEIYALCEKYELSYSVIIRVVLKKGLEEIEKQGSLYSNR